MTVGDGNGWVEGPGGKPVWGRFGAAGLFLRTSTGGDAKVLLQHRANWVADGGTWALPGGARDSHETEAEAALRETVEECGIDVGKVVVDTCIVTAAGDDSSWTYTTVLAHTTTGEELPTEPNAESADLRWVELDKIREYPLHGGFEASLDTLLWHCKNHD
ncbi:NUDIX domain-containing protein [Corynebacterium aquatimens]|uniref:8-oxo-dGTP diphosphatase n=1 Tax=Corynebacterium aquatimens TaxID=1190508 RepID=A0A931DYD4_9CORY|nr:NUDIX hydrolase [Corynebacterium aquatimens]MBG6122390.1 8-oxo-dGTP diphosphatase [Corynebacterium aquatimens]